MTFLWAVISSGIVVLCVLFYKAKKRLLTNQSDIGMLHVTIIDASTRTYNVYCFLLQAMTEGMQHNPSYMTSTNPDYEDVSDILPEQNLNTIN